jgi:hypothetical protein
MPKKKIIAKTKQAGAGKKKKNGAQGSIWDDIADILNDIIPLGKSGAGAAVSYAARGMATAPTFLNASANGVRIIHKEYVGDVHVIAAGYTRVGYGMNPGNVRLFPWLSKVASGYQKYKFNKLAFAYYPQCATDEPGCLLMGYNPDVTDTPPEDKGVLLRYKDSTFGNLWAPGACCVDMRSPDTLRMRYVRRGAYPEVADPHMYDVGNLYLATDATAAGPFTPGSLFVYYDVSLDTATDPQIPSGTYQSQGTLTITEMFGTTRPLVYGNVPVRWADDGSQLFFTEPFHGIITVWADATAPTAFTANIADTGSTATLFTLEGGFGDAAGETACALFRVDEALVDQTLSLTVAAGGGVGLTAVTLRFFEARIVDMPA